MAEPIYSSIPFVGASLLSSLVLTIQTRAILKQRKLHSERPDVFRNPDHDKNGEPLQEKHLNGLSQDTMTSDTAHLAGRKFSITKYTSAMFIGTILSVAVFGVRMGWSISRLTEEDADVKAVISSVLDVTAWIYVLFVSMKLLRTRAPNRSFRLLVHLAFVFIFAFFSSVLNFRTDLKNYLMKEVTLETQLPLAVSSICMSFTFILTAICSVTPRGPPLVWNGESVNPMASANLLSLCTFQFCFPLLYSTYRHGKINDVHDLAACTFPTRAEDIYDSIAGRMVNRDRLLEDGNEPPIVDWKKRNSLIKAIFKANGFYIACQAGIAFLSAILFYSPAYFMNGLLDFIQEKADRNRPSEGHEDEAGYWWVFGLLASKLAVAFATAALWYVSSSILQQRIKGQLNSAIYAKTLRRKDVIGTQLDEENETKTDQVEPTAPGAEADADADADADAATKPKSAEAATEEGAKDGKQNVLNLMAVDSDRVSQFATWSFSAVDAPIEVIVGIFFLYRLLGWSAFFGLAFMIFTLPLNHVTAQLFSKSQDRLMEARDRRVALMNEVLQGIRMIKFNAWEKNLANRIFKLRELELKQVRQVFIYDVCFHALWMGVPVIITVLSFLSFTKIQGKDLTPSIAFVSITVFAELRFALNIVPELIIEGAQALVSIRRIERYLASQEISIDDTILRPTPASLGEGNNSAIVMRDATITWPIDDSAKIAASKTGTNAAPTPANNTFVLRSVSVEVPKDALTLVVGPTGSGKTLLLLGLLGEAEPLSGQVIAPKSEMDPETLPEFIAPNKWILDDKVAYVAQTAWLQNKSVRDNILFGLPYAKDRYEETLQVCALKKDLEIFEDGDMTEIGEKGITLSGGQKARVALARAVYSRAKYLFMDDILSAVDAHTAAHIYEKCLRGKLLKGRTTVLVTHHVRLCLGAAAYIVALSNGVVMMTGDPKELRQSGKLAEVIKEMDVAGEKDEENGQGSSEAPPPYTAEEALDEVAEESGQGQAAGDVSATKPRKLIEDEGREIGVIKARVYANYLKLAGGVIYWAIFLFMFAAAQGFQVMETWWLRVWSSSYATESFPHVLRASPVEMVRARVESINLAIPAWMNEPINPYAVYTFPQGRTVNYYLGVYCLICFGNIIVATFRWAVMYFGSIKASRLAHEQLLATILRAPIRFYDTTPLGRILNRFAKDFETFDVTLPTELSWLVLCILASLSIIIVCTSVTPLFLIGVALVAGLYLFVGALYTYTSRELRRHDSTSKSPIYSQYSETLVGVATIRAFGASARFMKEMMGRIEVNVRFTYYLWTVNRWMSVWFSIFGGVIAWLAGLLALTSVIDAGLAGFSISFAIQLTDNLFWGARHYTALELAMVAFERILEYTELAQEPPAIVDPRPSASWPTEGSIAVEKLEVRYAPELDPVLKDISFQVKGGEKVGIVGRTGSGKSTLSISLFRFVDPSAGKIYIDGYDITQVGLEDLRSRLTVVEQEPTLLSGTIRSNLDPFDEHDESELYEALRRVHLLREADAAVEETDGANFNVFSDLDTSVSDNGKNFSNGQRQLLCLARALLKRSKIVIMDEATASVDFSTDRLIQEAIRSEFVDRTLLVVAHRLTTIADYDRILVLDGGRVAEFDTPRALMEREGSLFYEMCKKSGEWDVLWKMARGEESEA